MILRLLLRALCLSLCIGILNTPAAAQDEQPVLPPGKIADLKARFGDVKTWRITFRYSADNPYSWTEGGTTHNRTRWHETSEGSALMPTTEQDDYRLRIMGTIPASDSLDKYEITSEAFESYRATRYDRGSGVSQSQLDVTIDFEHGTYEWALIAESIDATYGGTITTSHESRSYGPSTSHTHVVTPLPAPAYVIYHLPETGTTISGSWSHDQEVALRPKFYNGFDAAEYARASPVHGTISWTITPAEREPLDVELIVEPQGYDAWMPEGGRDEATAGNQIPIRATLVSKDGGELKHHAVQMTFSLSDVSKEKGVALNFPVANPAGSDDLAFEASKNPGDAEILAGGKAIRFSKGSFDRAQAVLSSFDWGAFGTIAVVARLENGRRVEGHLKDGPFGDIRIPKRPGSSNIADAWKAATGFSGSDGEDEDKQAGNNHLGDGLTAYEEYRGLVIDGKHTRRARELDPSKKDLIVINEIGGPAAQGLKLFESASGIQIVEAKKPDFPESREVNANRGTASGGSQFGLRLRQDKLDSDTAGENRPAEVLNKTPKKSEVVVIDLALAADFYGRQSAIMKAAGEKMPYTLQEDIAATIAHEIAHGVGAPHHGKATEFFAKREVTVKMVDWKVYGINGGRVMPTESEPIKLGGNIGRPGNEASGDIQCIMAYTNYYQWAAVGSSGGPFNYFAVPPQPVGSHFCTSAAPTGFNLKRTLPNGAVLPSFFGPAKGQGGDSPVGNCLGAMKVRDW